MFSPSKDIVHPLNNILVQKGDLRQNARRSATTKGYPMSKLEAHLVLSFQDENANTVTFRQDKDCMEMVVKSGGEHEHRSDLIFRFTFENLSHLYDHLDDIYGALKE
jgi:hypothetical protein